MPMPVRRAGLSALALLAAAAAATAGVAGAAPAGSAAGVATGGPLAALSANVLPNIAKFTGVPTAADRVLSIGVAIARPDVAGEDAAFAAMNDPASPDYQHYFTPASFAARFGVPAARVDAVESLLTASGITVGTVSSDGSYISATGTVAAVEKAFNVTEDTYTLSGTTFMANTAAPQVPSLDGITTVVGLNTLQHFSRDSIGKPTAVPAASSAHPAQDTCAAGICTGLTTPQDLWSVYDQPANYEGKGASIAVIGEGDPTVTINDLRAGETAYGLPHTPVSVDCVQNDATTGKPSCGTDTSGTGEWQIDTQATLGMAPQADSETLYFAQSVYDPDLNNSFITWAQDPHGPTVASASLGECEAGPANGVLTSGPLAGVDGNLTGGVPGTMGATAPLALGNGEETAVDPILKEAAMTGKTLFASTGDTGSSCPAVYAPVVGGGNGVINQGLPEQNYPAVSTYVVAVGGTVLYTNDNSESSGTTYKAGQPAATRALEMTWDEGGGGASLYTPAPSWQAPVAAINQPCIIGVDGSTDATGVQCRGVPDVSAQSGDVVTNGYSLGDAGTNGAATTFDQGAGTSLSSPLTAGMWARVVGAGASVGKTIGFASPMLYKSGTNAAAEARDYYDITVGTNGLHTAGTGWDYTNGFGTPQVDGLICDIDGIASGRFAAAGVAGVCPLTPASTGTAALAPPAAASTTSTTTTKAPTVVKKTAKKMTVKKVAVVKVAAQPAGTLAYTGLSAGVPVAALLLLGGAGVIARRRRALR